MSRAPVDQRSVWQLLRAGEFVLLSDRQLTRVALVLVLVLAGLFWALLQVLEPPPPRRVSITTGGPSGAYHAFAQRYAEAFRREGITLELRPSAGSVENLARLADPAAGVAIGLVQSGLGDPQRQPGLLSLASVAHEPVWLLHRPRPGVPAPDSPIALAGGVIAVGPEGSGTRVVALRLLEAHGLAVPPQRLSPLSGSEAVQALIEGRVDALFLVAAVDAPSVMQALEAGLVPVSFARADALVRRMPWLSKVTLPRGVISLARDLPAEDVSLVAVAANLVVRDDLHPAITYLLMDVATQVHRPPTLLSAPGEFPSERQLDFAHSAQSQRYFRSGRPFLQRYLPFWVASLLERLALTLMPALAIVLPLARWLPGLLGWRAMSRILKLYHEIEQLDARGELDPQRRASALAHLDRVEGLLRGANLGARRHMEKYHLKAHLEMLRARLGARPYS